MDTELVSIPWLLLIVQWSWEYRYFFQIMIFVFPLDTYPEVGELDQMVVLFLISWKTSILFSIVAVPGYIRWFLHMNGPVFPWMFLWSTVKCILVIISACSHYQILKNQKNPTWPSHIQTTFCSSEPVPRVSSFLSLLAGTDGAGQSNLLWNRRCILRVWSSTPPGLNWINWLRVGGRAYVPK